MPATKALKQLNVSASALKTTFLTFLIETNPITQSLNNTNNTYSIPQPQSWPPTSAARRSSPKSTRWCHPCLRSSTRVILYDRALALETCVWLLTTITGQLGRVAVIGGSEDYTGAPYFSAMASARLGADMVGPIEMKQTKPNRASIANKPPSSPT